MKTESLIKCALGAWGLLILLAFLQGVIFKPEVKKMASPYHGGCSYEDAIIVQVNSCVEIPTKE